MKENMVNHGGDSYLRHEKIYAMVVGAVLVLVDILVYNNKALKGQKDL